MNWKCDDVKPATQNYTFFACENVSAGPSCPTGQYISSGTLKYGRWDNSVCPGAGVNSSTRSMYEVFNLPPGCLQGVNSCNLGNSINLVQTFGDPFPGVAKHVSLKFKLYIFINMFFIP